jgi:hypothetical protein
MVRPNEEFNENQLTFFAQYLTAWFCLVCLAVILILSLVMLFIEQDFLMEKRIRRKIFMLYEYQRLDDYSAKIFTFLFIMRRINIVIVSFLWQE